MSQRLFLTVAAVAIALIAIAHVTSFGSLVHATACKAGLTVMCEGDGDYGSGGGPSVPAGAKGVDVAIVGGRVVTNDAAGVIDGGSVLIKDGRIVAVGKDIEIPKTAKRIDAAGKWVTPGLIAPFSRLGITEVDLEDDANDANVEETNIGAAADVARAFDPNAIPIAVTRVAGVTRAMVAPGRGPSPIAGYGAAVDLSGEASAVNRARAFVYIEMGDTGSDRAGHSRMTLWPYLSAAFADARSYNSRFREGPEGSVLRRTEAEALRAVLGGDVPILMHLESAADIRQALALKKRRPGIRLILLGAAEGWRVAPEIAAAKVPVIVDAPADLPTASPCWAPGFRQRGASPRPASRSRSRTCPMTRKRTNSACSANRPVTPRQTGWIMDALRAITSVPAEIFGLDGVGRLKAGGLADVVVWDGDPLEVMSALDGRLHAGELVEAASRQTALRDRYRDLKNAGTKPFQYR
ncbi:MAG: amidohydrolase family protein [Alphaproteobacteria bacterium]